MQTQELERLKEEANKSFHNMKAFYESMERIHIQYNRPQINRDELHVAAAYLFDSARQLLEAVEGGLSDNTLKSLLESVKRCLTNAEGVRGVK